MGRLRRSQRIAAIVQRLMERPGELIPLGSFVAELQAAKSTVSEDIGLIRNTFRSLDLGLVETVAGAAGGVRYRPWRSKSRQLRSLESLSAMLSEPQRLLPGGFVYMTDIIFSPRWSALLGDIFATVFGDVRADVVVTVETKGIPLAMMTARAMGLPLVTCRRNSRVTEGSSVSITYVSGSSGHIETMSLAKRGMAEGSRVLFIDDFLKGGGTAQGMRDLMAEFEAEVVGTGVLVATREPERKLIQDFTPLFWLDEADARRGVIRVVPNLTVPGIDVNRHVESRSAT